MNPFVLFRLLRRSPSVGRVGSATMRDRSMQQCRPKSLERSGLALAFARRFVRTMEENRKPSDRARELMLAASRTPRYVLTLAKQSLKRWRARRGAGGLNEPSMPYRQRAVRIACLKFEPVRLNLPAAILATK